MLCIYVQVRWLEDSDSELANSFPPGQVIAFALQQFFLFANWTQKSKFQWVWSILFTSHHLQHAQKNTAPPVGSQCCHGNLVCLVLNFFRFNVLLHALRQIQDDSYLELVAKNYLNWLFLLKKWTKRVLHKAITIWQENTWGIVCYPLP